MLEMTNCIAIGVKDREESAARWVALGFQKGEDKDNWTEIIAGPLRFYLVEDGSTDVAFAFTSKNLEISQKALEAQGFRVDEKLTESVGEVFLRDPDGYVFNLS